MAMNGVIVLFFQSYQGGLTASNWIAIAAIVVPIFGGIIWIIVRATQTYDRVLEMKPKVDKIPLIEFKIGSIATYLAGKHDDFQMDLYKSESPQVLTDFGKEVLNAIGGKEFIDNNLVALIKIMDEQEFKSALDVETYAPLLISGEVSGWDGFTVIKNYIYNQPKLKNLTLDLGVASRVMGLYLRDKYLERYPKLSGNV